MKVNLHKIWIILNSFILRLGVNIKGYPIPLFKEYEYDYWYKNDTETTN